MNFMYFFRDRLKVSSPQVTRVLFSTILRKEYQRSSCQSRALFIKFVRDRRLGVIRMDLRNIVEEFLNVTKCKSLSGVKHQISCKFIAGEF